MSSETNESAKRVVTAINEMTQALTAAFEEQGDRIAAALAMSTARALHAAGLLATRSEREIVTTIEELDALPVGSVIRERDTGPFFNVEIVAGVFEKFPNGLGWFCVAGHGDRTDEIAFPAVVLHRATSIESEAGESDA